MVFGGNCNTETALMFKRSFFGGHQCHYNSTGSVTPFCSWQVFSKAFEWLQFEAGSADWLLWARWYTVIAGCQRKRKAAQPKCSIMDDTCRHKVLSLVWEREMSNHALEVSVGETSELMSPCSTELECMFPLFFPIRCHVQAFSPLPPRTTAAHEEKKMED